MTQQATVTSYPLLAQARRLLESNKPEDAARQVMAHLRRYPGHPEALALLGSIAAHLGALQQSEHFLRQAIARGGTDRGIRRELAATLNQQQRPLEALAMLEALERETSDVALSGARAQILDKLGRYEEALALQRQLVEREGDNPSLLIPLGHILRAMGQVDEAVAAYRRAATADYEYGEAWWGLASIKRRVLTDADIEEMRRGLKVAIDPRNSAPLHFAMAKAMHDRQRYAEAFHHYVEGNRQRAESLNYDPRELTAEVAEIEQTIGASFFTRLPDAAAGTGAPIFIVSLPRSGSTLLEQMLGSHPDIEAIGELPYAPAILRSVMELATRGRPTTVPQLTLSLSDADAATLGADYLRRAAVHRQTERPFFIDKLPHNWSNLLFLKRILPQARFVDIRRNPMDCCFSNYTQLFSSAHASSFDLAHIGQSYLDYLRLMAHVDAIAPGLVHHIDYEAMVADPEPHLRAALAYLGLPWDPQVLEFHKLDRVVRTPSSEQVRRPLNRDGVGTWEPYAEWLGPLREALGKLG